MLLAHRIARHALVAWCVAACATDPAGPRKPTVTDLSTGLNPLNELSGLVVFQAVDADSARVVYWVLGQPPDTTPFQSVATGLNAVATLGLKPSTTYYQTVDLIGRGGTTQSDTVQLTSGALPAAIQNVRLATTGTPGPGYTLTALYAGTSAYVIAFDAAGQIRWYREFAGGLPPGEAKQQLNGNFTVFLGWTRGWDPTYGWYAEFRPSGEIVQNHAAGPPYYTDNHELLVTIGDGHGDAAHVFGYDTRFVDLSPYGGPSNALVAGHVLVRQSAGGQPDFTWTAWDHFSLSDCLNPPASVIASEDFDHPNSLTFDLDGNYIASLYRFNAIVKIDARTGDVLWQLGGVRNQFTLVNDPLAGFGGQHSVRVLENGNLLVYDNGQFHSPQESRAVEYSIDVSTMTATLVWEYRHNPPIYTPIVGSVQRLTSGHTFVGFAQVGHVTEVAQDGTVVWEGDIELNGAAAFTYRAIRIASLYAYQRP
jgi:arylsulfotransferase ASST